MNKVKNEVLFVYANVRSQWRYVNTGLENSREYTIEEQLDDSEEVIVSGNFNLAHDVEVEIMKNEETSFPPHFFKQINLSSKEYFKQKTSLPH